MFLIFAAPVFISSPSASVTKLSVHEGNQFTLECIAVGFPAPEFMWYRGDEPIHRSNTRLQIIFFLEFFNQITGSFEIVSRLNITVIDRTDFNVFRCLTSNLVLGILSNDSRAFNLTVIGKLIKIFF